MNGLQFGFNEPSNIVACRDWVILNLVPRWTGVDTNLITYSTDETSRRYALSRWGYCESVVFR